MLLPPVTDPEKCASLRRDPAWVARVCAHFEKRLGLAGPAEPYPGGSAVSARFGDVVLKLFFPMQTKQAAREAAVHELLAPRLTLETPELLEQGTEDGWPYLVTSVVSGSDLAERWPALPVQARVALGRQIGQALAELHAQRPPGSLAVTWPVWSRVQMMGAMDQHRRGGCPPPLLEQIPAYLEGADLEVGPRGLALLHTAVRPEHLVVREGPQGWALAGLIGFAGAMVAPRDYEFGPVGLDLGHGQPDVLRAILGAYGIGDLPTALRRRLFAMALIRTDADLGRWLTEQPAARGTTLEALADHWFGG